MNAALMRMRVRRRHPEASVGEPLDGETCAVDLATAVADPCDTSLERVELRGAVLGCIAQLPERHRTVLGLRDLEERATEEASELLGLTRQAVKSRLHRARKALRRLQQAELVTHV